MANYQLVYPEQRLLDEAIIRQWAIDQQMTELIDTVWSDDTKTDDAEVDAWYEKTMSEVETMYSDVRNAILYLEDIGFCTFKDFEPH